METTSVGRLVIVGASLAGLKAAEGARRSGFNGEIVLIGQEVHRPYDRPPLSKDFLVNSATDVFYHDESVLRERLNLELMLGRPATGLNTADRIVRVGSDEVSYDRLVLATGAAARNLPSVQHLTGVATLRTIDDSLRIAAAIKPGSRVLIVGGGFIGSEIASSATKLGAECTIIEAAPTPLVRALGVPVGERISALHGRYGTDLLCGVEVQQVEGNGRITGVQLSNGSRLEIDLLVVGIGASPATQWLIGSGLDLNPIDGGVVCNQYLQSSDPAVYAAGDIAQWPNQVMGQTMRLENWSSAAEQGAFAAKNAVTDGDRTIYQTVPYYWSDWYGHRIQFVGTPICDEVLFYRMDASQEGFLALYRSGNRIVGAATIDGQRVIMKLRRMIGAGATWDEAVAGYAGALQPQINN